MSYRTQIDPAFGFRTSVVPTLGGLLVPALSYVFGEITGRPMPADARAEVASFIARDPQRAASRVRAACSGEPSHNALSPVVAAVSRALFAAEETPDPLARLRVSSGDLPVLDHGWHQDSIESPGGVRAEADLGLSVWVPLHDVAEDEGCVELIPGSHRASYPHQARAGSHWTIAEGDLPVGSTLRVGLREGEMLVAHPRIVHRTAPNTSALVRVALVLWYGAV